MQTVACEMFVEYERVAQCGPIEAALILGAEKWNCTTTPRPYELQRVFTCPVLRTLVRSRFVAQLWSSKFFIVDLQPVP